MATARRATSAGTGAGATVSTRIPWSWTFRPTGKAATRPSRPRATTTDSSISKPARVSARSGVPRVPAEPAPRVVQIGRGGDPDLAASVVATDRDLEPERQVQLGRRLQHFARVNERPPRRHRHAGRLDEPSLGEPILGHEQRLEPGPHGSPRRHRLHHGRRDMLELVGHDVRTVGKLDRGFDVVVRADDDAIGDRRGRAVGVGIEHPDPVAHRAGGQRQHPPELAAAEDADDGRRRGSVTVGPPAEV